MFEPLFLEGVSPSNAGAVLVHGLGALNLCWHESSILVSQHPLRGCYITSNQLRVYIWNHYVWKWQRATGWDSCSGTVCVSLSHSVTLWAFRRIAGWNVMNSHRLFSFLRLGECDLKSSSTLHHMPAINKGVLPPVWMAWALRYETYCAILLVIFVFLSQRMNPNLLRTLWSNWNWATQNCADSQFIKYYEALK